MPDDQSQAVAKLLQGWIAGMLMKRTGDMPLDITKVDVPRDADGNYVDYIEVTMGSGRRIHILLTSFDPGE